MNTVAITISAGHTRLVSISEFGIRENQISLLFGESGIGKSLIAKCLYGILDPDELRIRVDGMPYREYCSQEQVRALQKNSFFVFQEPSSHLNPLLSVAHQLREGSLSRTKHEAGILEELWGGTGRGFRHLLPVYPKPHRPSGGEKQRILLAMAFKKIDRYLEEPPESAPALFVFDEPTGSLDNRYRDIVLSMLMERYERRPFTVLLITHDYSMVSVMGHFARRNPSAISFRELARHERGLVVREFLPQTYTRWLDEQKSRRSSSAPVSSRNVLLEINTPVEVYGHRLLISNDPAGEQACPLRIFPGTLVYLKAPSGTGKTTLVKMIMGLIQGRRLRARFAGLPLQDGTPRRIWKTHIWGKRISLVFQHADEALNPSATVREVFQGLPPHNTVSDDMIRQTMRTLFDEPLPDTFLRRKVSALSGGQKQRLNLLRSLYLDTDLLIVDEPLNGLDFASSTKVISLLQERRTRGKSVLIISHNEEIFDTQVFPEHVYYLHAVPVKGKVSSQQ